MNNSVKANGLSVLIFRICLSGVFIVAGISHLLHPEMVEARIDSAAFNNFATFFGNLYWLGILSGIALLTGGIALLFGIYTRWAAIGLFLVLVPITITIQLGNGIFHGPLWKNVALFGGLVFFIINNPKVFSILNK